MKFESSIDLSAAKIGDDVIFVEPSNIYGRIIIGDHVRVGPFVEIQGDVEIGSYVKIGSHAFLCSGVRIGSRVFIGHGVMTCNDRWPTPAVLDEEFGGWRLKGPGDWIREPLTIGDDVIIGTGAVLLTGINIGSGAIIGAGAVVAEDVPPGVVVYGPRAEIKRSVK